MASKNDLFKLYQRLNPLEKTLVRIMSINYGSVSRNALLQIIHQVRFKHNARTPYPPEIATALRKLQKDRLVVHALSDSRSQSNTHSYTCHPLISLEVLEEFYHNELEFFQELVTVIRVKWSYSSWYRLNEPVNEEMAWREIRLAFVNQSRADFEESIINAQDTFPKRFDINIILNHFFSENFDWKKFKALKIDFQRDIIFLETTHKIRQFENIQDKVDYLDTLPKIDDIDNLLCYLNIQLGNPKAVEKIIRRLKNPIIKSIYSACLLYLKGNISEAINAFNESVKIYNYHNKDKKIKAYKGLVGVLQTLSLITRLEPTDFKNIEKTIGNAEKFGDLNLNYLRAIYFTKLNDIDTAKELIDSPQTLIDWLFYSICNYLIFQNGSRITNTLAGNRNRFKKAYSNGYKWYALEMASLLHICDERNKDEYLKYKNELIKETGFSPIVDNIKALSAWERSLKALSLLANKDKNEKDKKSEERIIWLLDYSETMVTLQAKIQKLTSKGTWTKGRKISPEKLLQVNKSILNNQDLAMCSSVEMKNAGWNQYYKEDYNMDKALMAIIGHPHIYLNENEKIPIEINKGEIDLIVKKHNGHFNMALSIIPNRTGTIIKKETLTRYKVYEIREEHLNLAKALGSETIKIPKEGKDQLLETITGIASLVNIQSDMQEHIGNLPNIDANPTPHVVLIPIGDDMKLELFVKPFSNQAPYLKPGKGSNSIISEVEGIKTVANRDLDIELNLLQELLDFSPTLSHHKDDSLEWHFTEIEDCLKILLELQELKNNNKIILEWPKGEKFKLSGTADFNNLSMSIKKDKDWFGVEGKIQVNEDVVMDLQHLLQIMNKSKSNFIEIKEGQFLALTDKFRKKMEEAQNYFFIDNNGLKIHGLAASAFELFTKELAHLESDKAWKEQINTIKKAKKIKAVVPKDFKATLRDYQFIGYQWLLQLAEWGVGACLADDMGLGKTIQVLAVLIHRAKKGPALVIAPASVARNWISEAAKFAPSLSIHTLREGDRTTTINNLTKNDVLISSYGLLHSEIDKIKELNFSTIVLDEAQAIKNYSSKRSKAAMKLNGDFKIITTGTPIENHLGELWNLFQFINPGLLGSLEQFGEKFAKPIERRDENSIIALQNLIRPFILRRRKGEVLKELPSKTEIMLTVNLNHEEAALYEALRREAVEKMAQLESNNEGENRIRILAEIMKLRRMCCNTQLVMPKSKIKSSKLKLFGEILEELLDNGHKVLVFSQFVGHLHLIRDYIESQQIHYQYLDGQTPITKRQDRIDAFQNGEGDVFLISLKAGGVGLNLTAADYVIHMDPWWNPAVEDQASDRAHRIGQTKPVTIYRLITEGTIEEKIVKLHQEKRYLADSLLEGTDKGAKITSNELLDLLKQNLN